MFVPDIPYHIQAVFVVTFAYIWWSAFSDKDYLHQTPTDPENARKILQANTWRAIYGVILFMLAFAYLKPYREYRIGDKM